MPEICRFLGIVIAMFYDDHNPPHFHARYEKYKATIDVKELKVLEGSLPPRVLGLVVEWATLHQNELLQEWDFAKNKQPLFKLDPLE